MGKKNQHVVHHDKGWAVKGEGNKRNTAITPTKEEAEQVARNIAKKNDQNCLFMGGMARFRIATVMEAIPVPQKIKKI